MTPRNTSTGAVLEAMVLPALDRAGYAWRVHRCPLRPLWLTSVSELGEQWPQTLGRAR